MIEKAQFSTDNDRIQIGIPFVKHNEEKRTVSGFATLDNVDLSGEVVTADASRKAFENFRGNVREQHLPIAAGKVVNFHQESYFDSATDRIYNGIFVDVYVSKGAQDTWEKVLDGTLTGFSIGGTIKSSDEYYDAKSDRWIKFINDYDLIELSLVDSPANHLCNVFSIAKSNDGLSAQGIATETVVENVFWCATDSIAIATKEEKSSCSICQKEMSNQGWFESTENKTEKMREIISKSLKTEESEEMKGGSQVAEKNTEEAELTKSEVTEEATETNEGTEVMQKSEEASEVATDEPDFESMAKALDEIKKSVSTYTEARGAEKEELIKAVSDKVKEVQDGVQEQLADLLKKHDALAEQFQGFKAGLDNVEKRLDAELDTAVKKSQSSTSNLDDELKKEKKGLWTGVLLPSND